MSESKRSVVITAAGVISSLADSPSTFHQALCAGQTGLGPVTLFEPGDGLATRRGGEIKDFNPETYLGKGNFRPLDRSSRLAASVAALTLGDSPWTMERRQNEELGLVLGTMFGSVGTISEFDRRGLVAGPKYVKPFDFANSVINAAAGQTAIWHSLRGVNSTVTGGPTASLQALAYATDLVRNGRADAVLAGGVEEMCFESFFGFSQTGLLSPGLQGSEKGGSEEGGSEECAVPLSPRRNGFLLGEGAVLFLLEEKQAARDRGATILAEIRGHGSAFDISRGQDQGKASRTVARSLSSALADAGITAGEIDAASLAASGSVLGDRHEALGFAQTFGEEVHGLPVTAVKSMLGETLGVSGAFQTLALVESLRTGVLPGIAGLDGPDPKLPLDMASAENRELAMERGVVHALGFDGNSCALVLEKASA